MDGGPAPRNLLERRVLRVLHACRHSDFFAYQTATYITGITSDGGYADSTIARAEALARMPQDWNA